MRFYIDDNKKETYVINDVNKTVLINKNADNGITGASEGISTMLYDYSKSNFSEKIKYIFSWKVEDSTLNDVNCYHIILENGNEIWIDKEQFTEVESIDRTNGNSVTTKIKELKLNSVKDEDVILPNLEGYEIINK